MGKRSAFTLIELLTVIAVIAILASISFGLMQGVSDRQARTRAQADLAAISAGLEAYRSKYGSYPVTNRGNELYLAMADGFIPTRSGTTVTWGQRESGDGPAGRPFLELDRFSTNGTGTNVEFSDPWGRAYIYRYSNDDTWKQNRFGFVLLSRGPSGRMNPDGQIPSSGLLNETHAANADNIYANR